MRGIVLIVLIVVFWRPAPDAEPLWEDAMFYMASVTKPIIYTCGMILVERGLLNLNSPVKRYIPEFTEKNKITQSHWRHQRGLVFGKKKAGGEPRSTPRRPDEQKRT